MVPRLGFEEACWWASHRHVKWNPPKGITASPGRYKYSARLTVFFEPWYLTVTCLTPCLPEECLRGLITLGDDFWRDSVSSSCRFDSGCMVCMYVYRGSISPGIFNAMPSQRRVLVVGGSFAGFCVARAMKNKYLVTLVKPEIFLSGLAD